MKPSERMAELNLTLPAPAAPVANYIPAVRTGTYIITSGQIPFRDGTLSRTGKVPGDVTIEEAKSAAGVAALNALAAAAQAAGGVDRITRILRVGVYVNSSPGFHEQPKVANGASDLLASIFGDAGRHARAAVGVAELPLNAVVEVEILAEAANS